MMTKWAAFAILRLALDLQAGRPAHDMPEVQLVGLFLEVEQQLATAEQAADSGNLPLGPTGLAPACLLKLSGKIFVILTTDVHRSQLSQLLHYTMKCCYAMCRIHT